MSNSALASTNQARKKGSKTGEIWSDKLEPLSLAERSGVEALIRGESAIAAWRIVHPDSQAGESAYVRASEWRRQKHIQAWVDAAQQAQIAKVGNSLEEHLQALKSLESAARRSGNYGAAAQCQIAIGRALGHYVERTELTIRQGRSTDSVLLAIESLLGSEAARIASMKLGIQYNQALEPIDVVPDQSIPVINQDQAEQG